MISAYRAGDTALHRMPAAAKLFALAVSALGLSLWHPAPAGMLLASLTASAILAGAGSPAEALRAWWRLRWLILVLGGALWALVGVDTAIVNTSRVVTLLLLAEVVTRTTRMADLVEVLDERCDHSVASGSIRMPSLWPCRWLLRWFRSSKAL